MIKRYKTKKKSNKKKSWADNKRTGNSLTLLLSLSSIPPLPFYVFQSKKKKKTVFFTSPLTLPFSCHVQEIIRGMKHEESIKTGVRREDETQENRRRSIILIIIISYWRPSLNRERDVA